MPTNLLHILFLLIFVGLFTTDTMAHEVGAPFSSAFAEGIMVHHAHIEDEQRINFLGLSNLRRENQTVNAFSTSVELAVTWTKDFNLGSEIFVPFSNTGTVDNHFGLGDIEIQPIKYAFLNEPERVVTGAFSITVPTGDPSSGLGGDQTALGGLLFIDQAFRNWYLGINIEYERGVSGPTFSEFEVAGALTYSFIPETGEGIAPARPNQLFVPTLMLELISEHVLTGAETGLNIITLLPGLQIWHPESNWKVRFGIGLPISDDREHDLAGHFQVGNHFDWGHFFE